MRRIALLAALLLALAGCADDEDTTSSSSAGADVGASASPTASGTRTVAHEKGEVEVPSDPERVVVLNSSLLDFALSLGVTPVGIVSTSADETVPAYLADRVEGIETVGQTDTPSLEAIAALDPDLILTSVLSGADELTEQLGAIAPTVYTVGAGTAWRSDFVLAADALGQADEAREALEEFDADAEQVAGDLGLAGLNASIVRFLADQTRVYGPESFSGSVLGAVGLEGPEADLDYSEFAIAMISPEQIELVAADIIFTTEGAGDETTRASVTAVWGGLAAIENGCQFEVDDETWMIGIGLISAREILDDVERLLADTDCDATE